MDGSMSNVRFLLVPFSSYFLRNDILVSRLMVLLVGNVFYRNYTKNMWVHVCIIYV